MTANVHLLETRPLEVQRSVIETLEDALKKAKDGTIVAVAIATVYADGKFARDWSKGNQRAALLGATFAMATDLAEHRVV